MKQKPVYQASLVIFAFLIAVYGRQLINLLVDISFTNNIAKIAYYYVWWLVPVIMVTGILFGFKYILTELGLQKGFLFGLGFSLVCTLPMLVSSAIMGQIDAESSALSIVNSTLFAGFMEEMLFRGFLFGLLFRKCKWGFIPASLLGAIIFASGHLYQGNSFGEALGVFMVTFMGALWFAWLYIEWNENLWVPVFLHVFMNLSWTLFDVGNNALGDIGTNVFRAVTIALTVILTIMKNNREKQHQITRKNLFINH